MTAKEFHPPNNFNNDNPSVFLAGPIKDAPNWQAEAVAHLQDLKINIANPRCPLPWHGDFNAQVDWETKYLYEADVIMFWLAKPLGETIQNRCYAQTSRFELGEWLTVKIFEPVRKLVMGIEPGFSNERYIKRRAETSFHQTIYSSFSDTINAVRGKLLKAG